MTTETCIAEPRIERLIPGFLTITCAACGDTWSTPILDAGPKR